jgi:O-antigen ligase
MAALIMLPFMKVSGVIYPLESFHLYLYNRMVVLMALLSPVLAVLALHGLPERFKLLGAAAVAAATAVMSWSSVSETAKLLSLLAPLVFGLAVYAPRLTTWLIGLGISAGYFLFFPLARWADRWLSQGRLEIAPDDYGSAWTRIKIWVKASERAAQNYWFGGGPNMMTANRLGYLGETLPAGQTAHAHSGIAQAWVDLGFVGVILIVAAALAGLYATRNFAAYHRAAAMTVLSLAFVVWAISHGMWQSWFHGMAGFCFAACALCTRAYSDPSESELRSKSLFGRIFFDEPGSHFVGKCSSPGRSGRAEPPFPHSW